MSTQRMLRLVMLSAVAIAASAASTARARPVVMVTIDVESLETHPLPSQVDPVCDNGKRCGLMEIVRMLNEHGLKGTFFLNVYEHTRFGEPAMRDIAVELENAGQDVELHTHPETVYDPARSEMYQYSLEEQKAIIKEGVRLLQSWTGRTVIGHRAGAYGADENTLRALEDNGIYWDSSMFWTHPKSHLDALGQPRNLPWRFGKVTELPVSVYHRDDHPAGLGGLFAPVSVVRKVDVDWLINEGEARTAIKELVAADVPVLVVFLHSFSLMQEDVAEGEILTDQHSIDMFNVIFDEISKDRLPVKTLRQISEDGLPSLPSPQADVVPRVPVAVDIAHYVWRRAKAMNRRVLAGSLVVGLAGFAVLAFLAIRILRRRSRRRERPLTGRPGQSGAPLQ